MATARTPIRPSGEVYKPEGSIEDAMLPAEYRNTSFLYVAYPGGWEWDAERQIMIPCLSEIRIKAGVNGIDKDLSPHRAVGSSRAKGGVIIEPTDRRLGEWMHFITRYKVGAGRPMQHVGWHYCFKSSTFEILPNGRASAVDGSAEFRAFRAHLVEAGIVPQISGPEVSDILAREELGLRRLIAEAQNNPHRSDAVKAKQARVNAIRAWWANENAAAVDAAPDAPAAPVRPGRAKIGGEPAPAIHTAGPS